MSRGNGPWGPPANGNAGPETGSQGSESAEGSQGTGEEGSTAPEGSEGQEEGNARDERTREKLRETEGALTTANDTVTRLQQREADRLAATHLANAADLFDVGKVELADLLADDGTVDADKVKEASEKLIVDRGDHFRAGYRAVNQQHNAGGMGGGVLGKEEKAPGSHLSDGVKSVGKAPKQSANARIGTTRLT